MHRVNALGFALYALLGAVLGAGGVGPLSSPAIFITIVICVLAIDYNASWLARKR
jgi:hypothetical protein